MKLLQEMLEITEFKSDFVEILKPHQGPWIKLVSSQHQFEGYLSQMEHFRLLINVKM